MARAGAPSACVLLGGGFRGAGTWRVHAPCSARLGPQADPTQTSSCAKAKAAHRANVQAKAQQIHLSRQHQHAIQLCSHRGR